MNFRQVQCHNQCSLRTTGSAPVLSAGRCATLPPGAALWIICKVRAASVDHSLNVDYHTFCRRPTTGPVVIHDEEIARVAPEGKVKDWRKVTTADADGNIFCNFEGDSGVDVDWINECECFMGE